MEKNLDKAEQVDALVRTVEYHLGQVEGNGTYDIPFLEEVFQKALNEVRRIKAE